MSKNPCIAIIDYGLGNLFSVKQACLSVHMDPIVTQDAEEIHSADGVILPGVGAFKRAMDALQELDLVDTLIDVPDSGTPLIGICLGAQLLMNESYEFGHHDGLGLIPGYVERLDKFTDVGSNTVPNVGWRRIQHNECTDFLIRNVDLFTNIKENEYFYFVHSYCIETDEQNISAVTPYGEGKFCSAIVSDNVIGLQFHPERSGEMGLQIYKNIRRMLLSSN